jgi:hypothetical protein
MSLTLIVPEWLDNGSHFGQGEILTSLIVMNGIRYRGGACPAFTQGGE